MRIAKDTVVSMHYTVATVEGEHVDRSEPGQPLVYLHGHGNIIPGLEAALEGHDQGERIETEIAAKDAYGEHDPGLDLVVGRGSFPEDAQRHLRPGFQFRAEHPEHAGEVRIFTVCKLEGDQVFVTGNHELAGKSLRFQVELAEVRAASPEELEHGHAHGPGGHHHH